jgi:hypothetical protein
MILYISIFIIVIWSLAGLIRFLQRGMNCELPKDFLECFLFYLVGGPISWIIGIGTIIYILIEYITPYKEYKED